MELPSNTLMGMELAKAQGLQPWVTPPTRTRRRRNGLPATTPKQLLPQVVKGTRQMSGPGRADRESAKVARLVEWNPPEVTGVRCCGRRTVTHKS